MSNNGVLTMTKREAGAELRALAKESNAILCGEEPRDIERLKAISKRSRVLIEIVGPNIFKEPL